jgi:hypothetical protein
MAQRFISLSSFLVGTLLGILGDEKGGTWVFGIAIYMLLRSWETKKEMDEEKAKQEKVLNGES